MLVILRHLILEMRRSRDRWVGTPRTTAMLLETGLSRADALYPTMASNIRSNRVNSKDLLRIAAKAALEETTFAAALTALAPGFTLPPPILGFFENVMLESVG